MLELAFRVAALRGARYRADDPWRSTASRLPTSAIMPRQSLARPRASTCWWETMAQARPTFSRHFRCSRRGAACAAPPCPTSPAQAARRGFGVGASLAQNDDEPVRLATYTESAHPNRRRVRINGADRAPPDWANGWQLRGSRRRWTGSSLAPQATGAGTWTGWRSRSTRACQPCRTLRSRAARTQSPAVRPARTRKRLARCDRSADGQHGAALMQGRATAGRHAGGAARHHACRALRPAGPDLCARALRPCRWPVAGAVRQSRGATARRSARWRGPIATSSMWSMRPSACPPRKARPANKRRCWSQ